MKNSLFPMKTRLMLKTVTDYCLLTPRDGVMAYSGVTLFREYSS